MAAPILTFRDLKVYREAFELQQAIFQISKSWPQEEKYSLTDQIRRSVRAIGSNLAESWAKRKYPSHFISKLTDADGELQETLHWLSTAFECGYISEKQKTELDEHSHQIGRMLGKMMTKPESFIPLNT